MNKIFIKTIENCWQCPNRFNIGGGEAKCEQTGNLVDKTIPPECPLKNEEQMEYEHYDEVADNQSEGKQ